jgi:hypothetical protein
MCIPVRCDLIQEQFNICISVSCDLIEEQFNICIPVRCDLIEEQFNICIVARCSTIMKAQGPWFSSQSPAKHSNKYFGTKRVTIILGTCILKDIFFGTQKNL